MFFALTQRSLLVPPIFLHIPAGAYLFIFARVKIFLKLVLANMGFLFWLKNLDMRGHESGVEGEWDFSWVRSFFLRVFPPGAEKFPMLPFAQAILWQGIMSGKGFLDNTVPVARMALGWLDLSANWEYEAVWP